MKYQIGGKIFRLAEELWPLNRSITGAGSRNTLKILKRENNELKILNFKSNSKAFDWKVPLEWVIKDAYILAPDGKKICDFKKNNLHLVQYSHSINKTLTLNELKKNIHFLKKQPKAIPYVTSYYNKKWGFCLEYNKFKKLKKGNYKVFINSFFKKGYLNIGEIILKGKTSKEVLLSTYICHPSMANNELSGPVVLSQITKWLKSFSRKYTYRIIFVSETIGSISYLSKNYKVLQNKTIAGFNLSCLGDERAYSFMPSRNGQTISDKIGLRVIKSKDKNFKFYDWSKRGSDERQYCSPGIDLPIASLMRSRYGEYKEYHTSLDKLGTVVSKKGLEESYKLIKECIQIIENNFRPKSKILCEPFLSKRNLYPKFTSKAGIKPIIMDVLTYCDGTNDYLDISKKLGVSELMVKKTIKILQKHELIK